MKALHKLVLGLATGVIAIGTGVTLYTQHRFGTDPLTQVFRPVRRVTTLPAQPESIRDFQFSSDGQSMFTLDGNLSFTDVTTREGDEIAIVRQWDMATGEPLAVFANPIGGEEGLRVSFDATTQRVAFEGQESMVARWDLSASEPSPLAFPEELQNHVVKQHLISGNGQVGAAQQYDPERDEWSVLLWELETGSTLSQIPLEGDERLALSQDGAWLAVATLPPGAENGVAVSVWEVTTGSQRHERQIPLVDDTSQPSPWIRERTDLTLSQMGFAGETLWILSSWNTQQQWDLATNTLTDPVELPSEFSSTGLSRVSMSPDGRWVAASGKETLQLYNLTTGINLAIPNVSVYFPLEHAYLAFSPDGQRIALRGNDEIQIRETASGRLLTTIEAELPGSLLSFSADGQTLVGSDRNGLLSLWQIDTGEVKGQMQGSGVTRQSWLGGNTLLTVGIQPVIRIWDKTSGRLLSQVVDPEQRWFSWMGLIPSGALLTQAYGSTTLQFWDATTAAPIMTQEVGVRDNMTIVANQRRLVIHPHYGDHPIKVWDLETQEKRSISDADLPTDSRVGLALRDDLLAIAIDHSIQLRSVATGELITSIPNSLGSRLLWQGAPIALSADGTLLAFISGFNQVTLWDLPSQRRIRKIPIPMNVAASLAFSPDDRLLAVGGRSGQLHFFELP
ncbi:MAG: hypothetical protein EA367_11360 [Leptolyngbya sp. DLM2.Bin15]|nr:MAG: hypothetical protein EA367_11360 [Leptolyngbya sp. DLM2.Bin15]